jgi:hypothetical protein
LVFLRITAGHRKPKDQVRELIKKAKKTGIVTGEPA